MLLKKKKKKKKIGKRPAKTPHTKNGFKSKKEQKIGGKTVAPFYFAVFYGGFQ